MISKQAKKSKSYKNNFFLPPHVSFSNGTFRFRYVFPPVLRAIVGKREHKINLGSNLELAQLHAYRLNCIVDAIRWELKTMHDETELKQLTQLMTYQSSQNLLNSVIQNIALLNAEVAPEDKIKLRVREKIAEATAKIEDSPTKTSKKLSEVYSEWIAEKRTKGIKLSTEKTLKTVWKELLWFFGDVSVFSISDSQMKDYYDFWNGNVPSLIDRAPRNKPALSYQQMQDKITAGEIKKYVSDTHKQNMLVYIREFLDWGASPVRQTQYFKAEYKTYLSEIETHRKRRGNKRGLTDDEIITIRGDLRQYKDQANSSYGDIRWRYWIFHILLLTGARPAEIGQLRVNDILTADMPNPLASAGTGKTLGMPCFLIAESEVDENGRKGYTGYSNLPPKSVKNEGSERLVPIHPWLIDDGFMGYVESRRNSGAQQLFDVKYRADNGYSALITQYYGRVIEKLFPDKKERNIKLYSTRNNFEEKIVRISKDNYDRYICQRLTGRIPQEGSVEAYRDQAELSRLYNIVQQVHYKFMQND